MLEVRAYGREPRDYYAGPIDSSNDYHDTRFTLVGELYASCFYDRSIMNGYIVQAARGDGIRYALPQLRKDIRWVQYPTAQNNRRLNWYLWTAWLY